MLTRVALGRARCTLPGLAVDSRGIVSGKDMALRFATLDRTVSFLRILSGGESPDEVWAGMRILYARPKGGGMKELVVTVPHPSTHVGDAIARAARLAGGQCFTGTGRHFVQYRDRSAPLGYDATTLSSDPADLTFYAVEGPSPCSIDGQIDLARLLLRLELRPDAAGIRAGFSHGQGSFLYLSARRGLAPVLAEYLFRAGVKGEAVVCEPGQSSPFGLEKLTWLFRLHDPPPRMLGLLTGTPGLTLYRPVLDNVAVAVGFTHPVHLDGCRAALPPDQLVLLAPPPRGLTVMTPVPELVPLGDLVKVSAPALAESPVSASAARPPERIEVPLRLVSSAGAPPKTVAAWIPWSEAAWLRRLCYALPPTAMQGYRVALLQAGVLVMAPDQLEGFPFGQLLEAAAPGVLVPVGTRFRPAVSPALIRERLGAREGVVWVFTSRTAAPFAIPDAKLEPLERRVLAAVEGAAGDRATMVQPRVAPPPDELPEVENDPIGLLPVWGLRR